MIRYRDEWPPVSEAELKQAERDLEERGHPLLPSYRAYLRERDGGQPLEDEFHFADGTDEGGASLVNVFLGVRSSNTSNVINTLDLLGDRMRAGILPIAYDTGGNLVCIDGRDGRDGPILFWDHEEETEPPSEENLRWVAPDLTTFLDMLVPNDPPPLIPPASGWRRLFGRDDRGP